jgi:hypothetical protein
VAAWDVTVLASLTSNADSNGRLFTYDWVAFTAGNGRPVKSTVYVVSPDGFRYKIDTRGLDPNGFAFYANRAGLFDSDGTTPLYHDGVSTSGALIVGEVGPGPSTVGKGGTVTLRAMSQRHFRSSSGVTV